ncbi:MAG: HDOD domain-containing protein [Pseudomonadales bacterium]|nr:HDOD domain-containing protein [Pseudomonadales bacterium]
MESPTQYHIFRSVIRKVLDETEELPSLPSITLKIRKAVADPDTTAVQLARLISQDPALSALLIKYSSSPLYRNKEPITTLQGAIQILGMTTVANIVMTHSIKSVFPMRTVQLRKLFDRSWLRQIDKASMGVFIASRVKYRPADEVLVTSLLTEVGTLAVLSALAQSEDTPTEDVYIDMCREYSRKLSMVLLTKWNVDKRLLDIVKHCGEWQYSRSDKLDVLDIINLALYHTALQGKNCRDLPPLKTIKAYLKLPRSANELSQDSRQLLLIENNLQAIQALSRSLT